MSTARKSGGISNVAASAPLFLQWVKAFLGIGGIAVGNLTALKEHPVWYWFVLVVSILLVLKFLAEQGVGLWESYRSPKDPNRLSIRKVIPSFITLASDSGLAEVTISGDWNPDHGVEFSFRSNWVDNRIWKRARDNFEFQMMAPKHTKAGRKFVCDVDLGRHFATYAKRTDELTAEEQKKGDVRIQVGVIARDRDTQKEIHRRRAVLVSIPTKKPSVERSLRLLTEAVALTVGLIPSLTLPFVNFGTVAYAINGLLRKEFRK